MKRYQFYTIKDEFKTLSGGSVNTLKEAKYYSLNTKYKIYDSYKDKYL